MTNPLNKGKVKEMEFCCDRCNRPQTEGSLWAVSILPDSPLRKDYYLCLKCKHRVEKWLKGELNPPEYRRE